VSRLSEGMERCELGSHSEASSKCDIDVVVISSDRYHPWNGDRLDQPDHVWADLPAVIGCDLVVYLEQPFRGPEEFHFGSVQTVKGFEIRPRDRVRCVLLALRSVIEGLLFDRRLACGVTPKYLLHRVYRCLLGRPLDFPVLRWQRAQVALEEFLRTRRPEVVLFHDEFGEWAMAICNACRAVGSITPIAYQHSTVAEDSLQYADLARLRGRIADGLLCVSRQEVHKWSALPIPVTLAGSRRPRWDLNLSTPRGESHARPVTRLPALLVPSLADTPLWQEQLRGFPHLSFAVAPHPLRPDGWALPNVETLTERLNLALLDYEVVITSSPNVQLTLGIMERNFVRVLGAYDSATETLEEGTYRTLEDALRGVSTFEELMSRSIACVPSERVPPDVSKESLARAINTVLGGRRERPSSPSA